MTEAEWLACAEPKAMLSFLGGKASARKLRLLACACARRWWAQVNDLARRIVSAIEREADGLAPPAELASLREEVERLSSTAGPGRPRADARWGRLVWPWIEPGEVAAFALKEAGGLAAQEGTQGAAAGREAFVAGLAAWEVERGRQCALVRDLFEPFRAVDVDPAWFVPQVVALARSAYEEARWGDLPVLADALEEAGCDNADVLAHCRGGDQHSRGCWVVDALLDKM
jgi:hypothetical protein